MATTNLVKLHSERWAHLFQSTHASTKAVLGFASAPSWPQDPAGLLAPAQSQATAAATHLLEVHPTASLASVLLVPAHSLQ